MDSILILDFGSQYAHLIAKKLRKLGFYAEIALPSISTKEIDATVKGIIFSGGPSSVYSEDFPNFNSEILQLPIPILGLCYGHQLLATQLGGEVSRAQKPEYGFALLKKLSHSQLFEGIDFPTQVWMSHGDEVTIPGKGFKIVASTDDCAHAVLENTTQKRYSLQFHAEVNDTPMGEKMLHNFASSICGMNINWDSSKVLDMLLEQTKKEARGKNVLLFLSGGVDSSVAFALLNKALGSDKVLGLYINNGFMRKNESMEIAKLYHDSGYTNFIMEDAEQFFLDALGNEIDPQIKRHIVGETYLKVREKVVSRLELNEDEWLLAQGTLYPDIIESGGTAHSKIIKTHHNRVEGVQALLEKGLVIEPLKELYKDEVRTMGHALDLPDAIIYRHPFPGPGISINLLCSDGILHTKEQEEFEKAQKELALVPTQALIDKVVLPIKSVGVQGDSRTYAYPAALKIAPLNDWKKLGEISSLITNSCTMINRCVVELFRKPGEFKLIPSYARKERFDMIREVDYIVINALKKNNWYQKVFQHLTISIPHALEENHCSIVLRPVFSEDVMTARFAEIDFELLHQIVDEIKKLPYVDALYYDITNKPPATFGWE